MRLRSLQFALIVGVVKYFQNKVKFQGEAVPKMFLLLEGRRSTKSSSAQILCKGDKDGYLPTTGLFDFFTDVNLFKY